MPEIAEVARTVHFIRKNLVGKTLAKVTALDDANVYGKVGTSGPEFQKSLSGKKVVDAGQQGKYFWMIMSSPPHPVMHFGMSGWLKYKDEHTYYYRKKEEDRMDEWPPKYWKFIIETKEEPKVEAAFVDLRRFARIRLVDCKAEEIRKVSPLVENGPDPVIDKDVVTVQWLTEKCRSKKVPIKAMLLDQANISGIGNWVGDEIMYDAKMHPEQYANTLSDDQIEQLHKSIHHICGTAVDLLADSEHFPEEWLFKHRWGKGKKDAPKALPNGEKIAFLTVGGRTSAVIPSIQKKTGPVAKEMDEAVVEDEEKVPKKTGAKKRKPKAEEETEEERSLPVRSSSKKMTGKKRKSTTEDQDDAEDENEAPPTNGVKPTANGISKGRKSKFKEELSGEEEMKPKKAKTEKSTPRSNGVKDKQSGAQQAEKDSGTGRRRSGRLGKS